ncbi:MAG: protein kinase, partial [Frankiales bacterium]|nr:protein kinase [Frankiales bacterium]
METTGGRQAGGPDPTLERPDPLVGAVLDGRYRIDAVIASGGMATVYAATDSRLDRTVAVKVMRPLLAQDPDFVERFAREARAAARLSSPEVVAVHDQGTDPATGTAYLVMEHVVGGTLRDLIAAQGALPAARALQLIEPVLRALAAAHAAGLVHRDVKPENVLLGDDGRIKVTDFGLARAIETSNLTATTGFLMGTMAYLAPEQVEQGRTDTRTDVYAAGILLWELLTGQPPYRSESPMTVAFRHVHEDVPPPSSAVAGVPEALDALVLRATRRDPEARPVDAGAFLEELQVVRRSLSSGSTVLRPAGSHPTLVVPLAELRTAGAVGPEVEPHPQPRPPRRWLRPLLAVLALLLVVGAAIGGSALLDASRTTRTPILVALSESDAVAAVRAAELEPVVAPAEFDEQMASGLVLRQDPPAREELRKGSTVTLVLSKGPDRRAVPDLVGMTREQATAALSGLGLPVGTVTEQFSPREAGTVLAADPVPGSQLPPQTPVALVLSKGVEVLPVPDVRGKERKVAEKALKDGGFAVAVSEAFSEDVAAGLVLDQAPPTGSAPRGTSIALAVSKGPELITVPNVVGMPRKQAEDTLTALGLKPRSVA